MNQTAVHPARADSGSTLDERPRVTLVGPLNMDLFMRGSAPLERDALDVWVGPSEVDLLVAGSIGYTAQAFARLDDLVELHSCRGSDAFGAHIEKALADIGISARFIERCTGQTGIAIYMLFFGGKKRPMTYRLPTFEPWPDPAPLIRTGEPLPHLVHSGGLLHFPDMWNRGQSASLRAAREAGVLTAIDPQFPLVETPAPWLPHIAAEIAAVDVLLCDAGELAMLFDRPDLADGIDAAHAAGPRIVAVKRGADGSRVSDGTKVIDQPAVPIPADAIGEAVGAGDAFDAGFLDALVRGADVAEAAAMGTAAAALTLRSRGGAEGIDARDAVIAMRATVPMGDVVTSSQAR